MNKKELIKRWDDKEFVEQTKGIIENAFTEGTDILNNDLRGLIVGSKSPLELYYVGLYKKNISETDFSFAEFNCAFFESIINTTIFYDCIFEGSSFMRTKLVKCNFEKSKFKAGNFDNLDALDVNFKGCKFQDKRGAPLCGLRSVFRKCDFSKATLKNFELRASKFIDCNFDGTKFVNCDLRGVKFEGSIPENNTMKGCYV